MLFQVIQVLTTVALVYYASVTIREAKRNRRKTTIERMLMNLYSPLREILTRARFESTIERNHFRIEKGPRDYALAEHEFNRIRKIIERFGHYLDSTELLKLRKDLQKYDTVIPAYDPNKGPTTWYRFLDNDLDQHLEYVEKKCVQLGNELRDLTSI